MKLSTKGRYAVTAMMDLAIHEQYGPVTLADISICQGISLSYLEQIFAKLRKSGLITGTRGPRGGYRLARSADRITVAEIITVVNDKLEAVPYAGKEGCQDEERCLTHELWFDLSSRIYDFLNGITLAQFAERPGIQEMIRRQDTLHFRRAFARQQEQASTERV